MSAKIPSRRKTKSILISPKFQLSFLGYIAAIAGFTLAVFYGGKTFFFYEVHQHMRALGIPDDHLVFDFLNKQSHLMNLIFLTAAFIEVTFLAIVGLRLSHRVAGPIYRLCVDLRGFSGEQPPREVKFRKNDYFPELADAFNGFLSHIQGSEKSERKVKV